MLAACGGGGKAATGTTAAAAVPTTAPGHTITGFVVTIDEYPDKCDQVATSPIAGADVLLKTGKNNTVAVAHLGQPVGHVNDIGYSNGACAWPFKFDAPASDIYTIVLQLGERPSWTMSSADLAKFGWKVAFPEQAGFLLTDAGTPFQG